MRKLMLCASALVLLGACGKPADPAALKAMNLDDGKSGKITWASQSNSGKKTTFKDVVLGAGEGEDGLKAESLTVVGLEMAKDGPVFEELTFKGLSPQKVEPGVTVRLDTLTVKKPNAKTANYIAAMFSDTPPTEAPPFAELAFDQVSFQGLKFVGDMKESGEGTFEFNLGEIAVNSLKDKVAASAQLKGMTAKFDIPNAPGLGAPVAGTFDWQGFEAKGVRGDIWEATINSAMADTGNGDPEAAAAAFAEVMGRISPIEPGYDTIAMQPINLAVSGVNFVTSAVNGATQRNAEGVATKVTSDRMTMKLTADPQAGQLGSMLAGGLGMLGYESVELYGQSDATFDPATNTTRLNGYNFGMTDGIDIKLDGGFQGVREILMAVSEMDRGGDMNAAMQAFKIADMDFVITDKSLVNNLINLSALMGGGEPEAMRQTIIDEINGLAPMASSDAVDPAVVNEFVGALTEFVKKPGQLSIKLKPAQPFSFATVSPEAKLTKESLGLSVTYTPPAAK